MRYLCKNPDCGMFAKLVAGSRPTCIICGQRVLDEKVMLKHGRSLQSIVASKGRVLRTPAPPPRQDESILDQPTWREERDLAPRRPYEETKASFTKEQLTEELAANGSVKAIAQKHHIALDTVRKLLEDFGVENPRARGKQEAGSAQEVTPAAEMMPESLAPTAAAAIPGPEAGLRKPEPAHKPTPEKAPAATAAAPPAKTNATDGLRIQITRAGKPAQIITQDLNTILGSLEYRNPETPFNLTVILEEVAG